MVRHQSSTPRSNEFSVNKKVSDISDEPKTWIEYIEKQNKLFSESMRSIWGLS